MIRLSSVRTSRGADDLLSIFAYILISSGLPCAISETAFMDDFLTEASRVTRMGYFLATLQATVELINGLFGSSLSSFDSPLLSLCCACSGLDLKTLLAKVSTPTRQQRLLASGGGLSQAGTPGYGTPSRRSGNRSSNTPLARRNLSRDMLDDDDEQARKARLAQALASCI